MKAEEVDRIFEGASQSLTQYLDPATSRRPDLEIKRVNVDFPIWMVQALDREAQRVGVSRQAIVKTWLAECLSVKASQLKPISG